jgi:hybrid cluster-associated redox disulfide protein
MQKINKEMIIGEVLRIDQGLAPILLSSGMHCLGCPSSQMESLEEACMVHGINVDELVNSLNEYLTSSVL